MSRGTGRILPQRPFVAAEERIYLEIVSAVNPAQYITGITKDIVAHKIGATQIAPHSLSHILRNNGIGQRRGTERAIEHYPRRADILVRDDCA